MTPSVLVVMMPTSPLQVQIQRDWMDSGVWRVSYFKSSQKSELKHDAPVMSDNQSFSSPLLLNHCKVTDQSYSGMRSLVD